MMTEAEIDALITALIKGCDAHINKRLEECVDAIVVATKTFVSERIAAIPADASVQRQLSRHADHLAAIESKLKRLAREQ